MSCQSPTRCKFGNLLVTACGSPVSGRAQQQTFASDLATSASLTASLPDPAPSSSAQADDPVLRSGSNRALTAFHFTGGDGWIARFGFYSGGAGRRYRGGGRRGV